MSAAAERRADGTTVGDHLVGASDRRSPAAPDGRGATIAFVLKGYPRLSETFIAQEILGLEHAGLGIRIVSLRHPTDRRRHPIHDEIAAAVRYLPEYLHHEPARVARAWWAVRRWPGYRAARAAWLRDLRRDPTPNRVRRFGQALVMAHELEADVAAIHAHFIHTPASVARYASLITGLPWSCSAHAKDIWTLPEWEKREKLASCRWTVTCTQSNVEHLRPLAPAPDRVALVYHGLDFERFPSPDAPRAECDGSDPGRPVRILSVGRLVEKKGYDDLLVALARLPATLHWRFEHVGGGDRERLERLAAELGIATRIHWHGALAQREVLALYRESDVFVLASRIADDGDRDGLPNVLMEAQSQGLACVSTRVSAIPELIDDGVTGDLVAPRDPEAMAAALAAMITDPLRRRRLGDAGARRVRESFAMRGGIEALMARFTRILGAAARGAGAGG
ncbi:MAG: glycosyltransferase family 4 protein [Chromatiales bacterium]|nr:glycosyltransferase family 4 protein [Chromatiales bacterium]